MSQEAESGGEKQVRFSPEVEEFPVTSQRHRRRRRRGGSREEGEESRRPGEPNVERTKGGPDSDAAQRAGHSRGDEQGGASDNGEDAEGGAKEEGDGLAAWHLLIPTLLIIAMSIGFTLTPPDPDFYYELPEVVKEALRTEREAQKSRPVDPAFMRKPRPAVHILSPACDADQYPCVADKPSLEFRTEHFSVPGDGERLVVIDGSRHYLDRGNTGAPQGAVMALNFDGLQGVGPHEATVMLLTPDNKVVAEDSVTFNLQESGAGRDTPPPQPPSPAPSAQRAQQKQQQQQQPPSPPPPNEEAKARPRGASPPRIPARAVDGYVATLLSPAPGARVHSPEVRFVTEGLAIPDEGFTVLRVDGQDHSIGVARGRLAMQGVLPGEHVVQIILADTKQRVLAASEEVSFIFAEKEEEEEEKEEEKKNGQEDEGEEEHEQGEQQPQGGEGGSKPGAHAPTPETARPQQSGQGAATSREAGRRVAALTRDAVERMRSSELRELAMNPHTPEHVLDWADEVLEARVRGGGGAGEQPSLDGAGGGEEVAAEGTRLGESTVPEPMEGDVLGEGPWTLPGGRQVTAEEVTRMSAADLHALVSDPETPEELVDIAENELDVRLIQGQGDLFD